MSGPAQRGGGGQAGPGLIRQSRSVPGLDTLCSHHRAGPGRYVWPAVGCKLRIANNKELTKERMIAQVIAQTIGLIKEVITDRIMRACVAQTPTDDRCESKGESESKHNRCKTIELIKKS